MLKSPAANGLGTQADTTLPLEPSTFRTRVGSRQRGLTEDQLKRSIERRFVDRQILADP